VAHEVDGVEVGGGLVGLVTMFAVGVRLQLRGARIGCDVLVSTYALSLRMTVPGSMGVAPKDVREDERKRHHGRDKPHGTASVCAHEQKHQSQTSTIDRLCVAAAWQKQDGAILCGAVRTSPMPIRPMHTAVLMVAVPPAVEVRAVRIAVHVPIVAVVAAPWFVHLAVLMISIPVAIEMPAVGVAMHVPMMVAVPVISIDVDVLRLVHDPILSGRGWADWRGLGCCRRERQQKARAHRQHLHA
jgi:hypothetical protein